MTKNGDVSFFRKNKTAIVGDRLRCKRNKDGEIIVVSVVITRRFRFPFHNEPVKVTNISLHNKTRAGFFNPPPDSRLSVEATLHPFLKKKIIFFKKIHQA